MPDLPDNFVFLQYPTDKHYILDPNLHASSFHSSPDGKTITFTLISHAVAPFVFLNLRDHTHGHFSDNGFIMVESEKELIYYSRDVITLADFESQLDITSLFDVTPFAVDDHEHDDDDPHDNSVCVGVAAVPLLLSILLSLKICFM